MKRKGKQKPGSLLSEFVRLRAVTEAVQKFEFYLQREIPAEYARTARERIRSQRFSNEKARYLSLTGKI